MTNTIVIVPFTRVFVAFTVVFVIVTLVNITESMVKRIDTIILTTKTQFSGMEIIISILDTTFSFTEKTVGNLLRVSG
jgi:hypothetical protein